MNNAFAIEDEPIDNSALIAKKENAIKVLKALNSLLGNEDWLVLQDLLFNVQVEKLEKQLKAESLSSELNNPEIYRLQGKLEWVRRYDIYKLAETYKTELDNLTKKLNENATTI